MAKTTEFIEFKEEVLPKLIPAAVPGIWFEKPKEDEEPEEEPADGE